MQELYYYFWYFFLYAFGGWCLEVAYKAVSAGRFVNRGFLNGAVCPIYGIGMVLIIAALSPLTDRPALLFVGAVALTSGLEWLTGLILEKAFHAKWWDYSNVPFNLNGYICLKFSILWGLACMIVMDVIQPLVSDLVHWIPLPAGQIILGCFGALMLADTILTVNTVMKLNKQLRHLEELGAAMRQASDSLGENIFEGVTDIRKKSAQLKEKMEETKEEVSQRAEALADELQEKRETFVDELREKREAFAGDLQEKREAFAGELEEQKEALADQLAARRERLSAQLAELKEKMEESADERHFGQGRLLKAFPEVRHLRYSEALEHLKAHSEKK